MHWLLIYFLNGLSSGLKELSLCHKLKFSNSYRELQSNIVNILYFKIRFFNLTEFYSLKYLSSTTVGCKDKGIRK